MAKNYLAKKIGFNPSDPYEFNRGMEVYKLYGLVTKNEELYPYFC
jgi:hypothetical protein